MKLVEPGDLVLLLGGDRKPFFLRAADGGELQTHHGVVRHASILGQPWGTDVRSHLGYTFLILPPSLHDLLLYLRRQSQIIFPKDLGYILLRLSAGPGRTILEAGTGSGGLTTALAWMVGLRAGSSLTTGARTCSSWRVRTSNASASKHKSR